tara:strand:+ start:434 stop:697 length:264 start_codon:yes stop_codon:yes gene_type:complete
MKGILFFIGSLLRWPIQNPKQFLYFHIYTTIIYGLTYLFRSFGLNTSNLVFTLGMIAPALWAINQGLPLDCLNYKSAIERELASSQN